MSFARLTHWRLGEDGAYHGTIPEDWMQGRTAFGGLVTAAACEAMGRSQPMGPLRSVSARFLEPVEVGSASLRVEALRHGRSVSHAAARVHQAGRLCTTVEATFGAPRASAIHVAAPAPPPAPAPGDAAELPWVPGVMPAFTQHVAMRWADGGFPFSGSAEPVVGGWCRHRTEARGVGALIGLLDAWPGPVLPLGRGPFAASTVHWTAHLVADEQALAPLFPDDREVWLRFRAEAVTAGDGYATTRGAIWAPDGRMLAWMEQLLAVYDRPAR